MGILRMYFIYYPIFWIGYLAFKITRKTNWYAYIAFRRLFVLTRGRLNDRVNKQLSNSRPPYEMEEPNGVLGKLSRNQIDSIVEKIKENGFYIFDTKLDVEKVDELTKFARTAEAKLIPPSKGGIARAFYSAEKPLSPRYEFDEGDIMNHPIIQQLSVDSTFFAIAQMYLGAKPIQDLTAMWWSTAFAREASSEAAQLFHFDMDRFKFIKFFIYLTDVDTFNGPHCYIRGSHKNLPDRVWRDGRIQDLEIERSFVTEDIIEIIGSKGTIIAADTRGLHKGKVLERGERLILQFEYANSLFGTTYERVDLINKVTPATYEFFRRYSYSFQRFEV